MQVVAIKTFSPDNKGQLVKRGTTIEVEEQYGRDLIRGELAVEVKDAPAHENKMLKDYEDKGMITTPESEAQRSQGKLGPTHKSETPEQRNQGKNVAAVK